MAGYLVSDYGLNDHWTELLSAIEKQRKGYLGLSLTNYDNSSLPAIAAGSFVEANGALYGFSSEEAIGGSPTTANINYIIFDPTPITLAWSIVAPTWSDAKNGWYDAGAAKRYIGGCYYVDTPTYTDKWIYSGIRDLHYEKPDSFPAETRYYSVPMLCSGSSTVVSSGSVITMSALDQLGFCPVCLPHGAIVTNFYSYCNLSDGTVSLILRRRIKTAGTGDNMAQNVHSSTGGLNDSSIDDGIIDNQNYDYYIQVHRATHTTNADVYGITLTYTIVKPLP